LLKSVPDRPGIRAVDAYLELEFHPGRPFTPVSSGIVVSRPTAMTLGTIPSTDSRSFDKFKTSAFPPDILMCLDWRRWLVPAETQRQPDAAFLVTKADRPWENESPHMNAAIPERRPATEEISGLIERVTFHNDENGFCVLRVSGSSGEPSQAGAIV
jgi:hypothetical protein